jgi:hypothetical protein
VRRGGVFAARRPLSRANGNGAIHVTPRNMTAMLTQSHRPTHVSVRNFEGLLIAFTLWK